MNRAGGFAAFGSSRCFEHLNLSDLELFVIWDLVLVIL
jgi:hypothetical protein